MENGPNRQSRGTARRTFVAGSLGVGATALGFGGVPALAAEGERRRVAVLGGGVAGLTAAQELAERGFEVTVWERKELGGKSRSIPVQGTGTGGRKDLPGEHGFRYVPGFYHHLPETMARIPAAGGGDESVHDHLVAQAGVLYSRTGGREDLQLESNPDGLPSLEDIQRLVTALAQQLGELPPHETAFFARQIAIFATSGEKRRFGQWEKTPWRDFLRTEEMSEEFRKLFAEGLTTHLVASRPDIASTRATGILTELYFYALAGRGSTGKLGRVLDAPTSESWIRPWVAYLRQRGVRFQVGWTVEELALGGDGRISGGRAGGPGGESRAIEADWYVCAMPVERARKLWSPALRRADPALARMDRLRTEWMNGIQFYLDRPTPVLNGFVDYLDSPWALVSLSQAQYWGDFPAEYGDGTAAESFSVNIAQWDEPGIVHKKPARECTPEEIAEDTLAQMRAALEDTGRTVLPEEAVLRWHLDPAISYPGGGSTAANDEPLIVSETGSWDNRPGHRTAVPNLFLAADYVRDNLSCATMEGANETAKRAVNALLEEAGSDADPCTVHELYVPPEFGLLRKADDVRYRLGLPHILDTPWEF
ncbi:FAD-dependent oxidoreductase [Streptomyces armeniacus]|uniref:FAD-dependent oxidoreductase n=1 Tax=Streptomyces armeniacus TaxID=83291 RepID=UPI001FEA6087|nr:FAD-dependent oxidoreductase [Streptomyces armeniacus]